jgi:hypothetical protein
MVNVWHMICLYGKKVLKSQFTALRRHIMKRTLIAFLLSLVLALGTLTGCGGETEGGEGENPGLVQPGEGGEEGED